MNLQHNLDTTLSWSTVNKMQLFDDKFDLISHSINTDNNNLKLLKILPHYNELTMYTASKQFLISPSPNVKDLGITVDNKLNWSQHIFTISRKSKQISGWILSVFYCREPYTMLTLFNALVRSRLEYCCELWNPHLIGDINVIEKVQRSFTHRIDGMRELNYWERLEKLKIFSLQRRREQNIIVHVWKILNQVYPNTVDMSFKENRRSNAIRAVVKPLPRLQGKPLTVYEESFLVKAAKLWNCVPPKLTRITVLGTFKTQLNKFLKDIPDKPPIPGYPYINNNSLIHQNLSLNL